MKLVIDITGGVINSVQADGPAEVIFVDYDDGQENPRAIVPADSDGPATEVWASQQAASVESQFVTDYFAGIQWLPYPDC